MIADASFFGRPQALSFQGPFALLYFRLNQRLQLLWSLISLRGRHMHACERHGGAHSPADGG